MLTRSAARSLEKRLRSGKVVAPTPVHRSKKSWWQINAPKVRAAYKRIDKLEELHKEWIEVGYRFLDNDDFSEDFWLAFGRATNFLEEELKTEKELVWNLSDYLQYRPFVL